MTPDLTPYKENPAGPPLRLATRGSALALWQANWVAARLQERGQATELVVVETQGDRSHAPFAQLSGQGFFTAAVQAAVLSGQADFAVHSLKDLPSERPAALTVAAIPGRADPRDVLLTRPGAAQGISGPLPALGVGARVGTSAVRRRAQLQALRPDLDVQELRGNVPTRLERLRSGAYDAVVLAAAGLERLGLNLSDLRVDLLDPQVFVPAPGQGALALECRADDPRTVSALRALDDPRARQDIAVERGLMARLQGGCQLALGAWLERTGEQRTGEGSGGGFTLHVWYGGRIFTVQAAEAADLLDAAWAQLAPLATGAGAEDGKR